MKRKLYLIIALCLLLLVAGCAGQDATRLTIVREGRHHITPACPIDSVLVILDGMVLVEEDACLTGPVYMLNGQLEIAGTIEGDVSVLDGEVQLAATSLIDGNLEMAGGHVLRSPDARITGQIHRGQGPGLPVDSLTNRRSLQDTLTQALIQGLLLALAAALLTHFFPRPLARVGDAACRHSLVSLSLGLLVALVGVILLVIMAFTVILLPVTFLGLALGFFLVAGGLIAIGSYLGHWLAPYLNLTAKPIHAAALGTLLLVLLLGLLNHVPLIGSLASLLIPIVGIGGVLLTRFGTAAFVPAAPGVAIGGVRE